MGVRGLDEDNRPKNSFRAPGGGLFETAADPPSLAIDEPRETLLHALKLPPRHEADRAQIERLVPPIRGHDCTPIDP